MRAVNAAVLPGFLRPFQIPELVRLGRDRDGGYLLDERCIADADCLVSIGINDDWSFEKDFKARSRAPLVAVDATTSKWLFRRRRIQDWIKWFLKGLVGRKYRHDPRRYTALLRDYDEFFRNGNRHVRKYVAGFRDEKHMTIDDMLNEFVPKRCRRLLLKIDIEGSEYGILDDICAVSDRLSGLLMEFHDVPARIGDIESFVAKLPLSVCHVHCNNFGGTDDRGMPVLIEVSFTSREVGGACAAALPHALDKRNLPDLPEIPITFE